MNPPKLTAINSLLAIVSIPAVLYIGQLAPGSKAQLVNIPFDFLVKQLLIVTFVPVGLGMLIKHFAPGASVKIERVLFPLTSLLFFVLIFFVWITEFETCRSAFINAGAPAISLFVVTCLSALLISRAAKLQREDSIATVYEVDIQNPPVAQLKPQGMSLLSNWQGQAPVERTIAAEFYNGKLVRKGPWKATWMDLLGGSREWELYNLENDPGEMHNLVEQHPEILQQLLADYENFARENGVVAPSKIPSVSIDKFYIGECNWWVPMAIRCC